MQTVLLPNREIVNAILMELNVAVLAPTLDLQQRAPNIFSQSLAAWLSTPAKGLL